MERKVTKSLKTWKSQAQKKPLVIMGARQIGKTTSVLEFAKECYADAVHIDFYRQPHLKAAFEGSLEPRAIIIALEALLQRDIIPGKTLLFLDEIQDCDAAITALKFFRSDLPELDVIAAGSLLGVHVARSGSFPVGYVDILNMHPMDFEEFLWALGEERSVALVRQIAPSFSPCVLHDKLMALYRDYLIVGGMPEAVGVWVSTHRLEVVRKIQEDIRTAYVADMAKYATAADSAKILSCWESVPEQLAKESGSTKFMWKYVQSGAKAERYSTSIDWLVASGIVSKCTRITDGISPLKSFETPASFKIYMTDTGLLACAYDARPSDFDGKDHRSARFRGGMAENYVMQQLAVSDLKPYYWGSQSTNEVEFVLRGSDGVVPIEVKSGSHVKATSAMYFASKYGCPYVLRVSAKNFGTDGVVKSVPLYAAFLIPEMLEG